MRAVLFLALALAPALKMARAATTLALPGLRRAERNRTRTGGPDDDDEEQLRWLMPLLALVIVVALVFSD
jgi:hypothetical protein